jgi:hypothetical protein
MHPHRLKKGAEANILDRGVDGAYWSGHVGGTGGRVADRGGSRAVHFADPSDRWIAVLTRQPSGSSSGSLHHARGLAGRVQQPPRQKSLG